jgi:hypothetical protein
LISLDGFSSTISHKVLTVWFIISFKKHQEFFLEILFPETFGLSSVTSFHQSTTAFFERLLNMMATTC